MKSRTNHVAHLLIEYVGHKEGMFFACTCLHNERKWHRYQDVRFWQAVMYWVVRSGEKCGAFPFENFARGLRKTFRDARLEGGGS